MVASREQKVTATGNSYRIFHGPDGTKAYTVKEVWEKHGGAPPTNVVSKTSASEHNAALPAKGHKQPSELPQMWIEQECEVIGCCCRTAAR